MQKKKSGLKKKLLLAVVTVVYAVWVIALIIVRLPVSTDSISVSFVSDAVVTQEDLQLVYDNGKGFVMPYVDDKGTAVGGTLINAELSEDGTLAVKDGKLSFSFSTNQTNAQNLRFTVPQGELIIKEISFSLKGKEVFSYTSEQIYKYFEANDNVKSVTLSDEGVVITAKSKGAYISGNDEFIKQFKDDTHKLYAQSIIMIIILTIAYAGVIFGKNIFKKYM